MSHSQQRVNVCFVRFKSVQCQVKTVHANSARPERPNAKYAENCVTLLNAIRPFENLISRIILKPNALLSLNRSTNRLNRTSENGTLESFISFVLKNSVFQEPLFFYRSQILRYRRDIPMY